MNIQLTNKDFSENFLLNIDKNNIDNKYQNNNNGLKIPLLNFEKNTLINKKTKKVIKNKKEEKLKIKNKQNELCEFLDNLFLNCLLIWVFVSTIAVLTNNINDFNLYKIFCTICQNLIY